MAAAPKRPVATHRWRSGKRSLPSRIAMLGDDVVAIKRVCIFNYFWIWLIKKSASCNCPACGVVARASIP